MDKVRLTTFSHGAGCGCKISPRVLESILAGASNHLDPLLLVGNETKDDAAVYDSGNGQAIISTADFFMPIVDDPQNFGAIASANALSDVYAMGGRPLMAIAILGWPLDKLSPEIARDVLQGSRQLCADAGIALAGGHSIDCPEPIFGLSVTGTVNKQELVRNSTAQVGDLLYLTKPIGVGIVTTAEKQGYAAPHHLEQVTESMKSLNSMGALISEKKYAHAMTDVTGFGLLGHLAEMCEASGVSAQLNFEDIPKFDFLDQYLDKGTIPGGTKRNWDSYGHKVNQLEGRQIDVLADPQTSGGLLISVDREKVDHFVSDFSSMSEILRPIGCVSPAGNKLITVQ